jgi:hypothetical protein
MWSVAFLAVTLATDPPRVRADPSTGAYRVIGGP